MAKRTKHLTSQGVESDEIRINKFLSEAGVCSRREADRFIEEGKVVIDGVKAEIGSKVGRDSIVTFMGKPVKREEKLVLIALNKPEGIVCTTDLREPDNIIEFIGYGMRIYPIGRLDKDSEGLILLTNDGNIVNKILRAENHHEKEYIVTVNKEITQEFIKGMSQGVPILNTVTKPCEVSILDRFTFRIILTQGLNRQIRRMCEYFDYRVINLTRIRIMNINLGRLKTGNWRNVTEKEIADMNRLIQTGQQKGSPKPQSNPHLKSLSKSQAKVQAKAQSKPKESDGDKRSQNPKGSDGDKRSQDPKGSNGDKRSQNPKGSNGDKRSQNQPKKQDSSREKRQLTQTGRDNKAYQTRSDGPASSRKPKALYDKGRMSDRS